MEFFTLSTGPSSSRKGASEVKVKVKDSDLLRRVGECDDEESLDGVDCRLSLGLPSSAVDHGRRPGPAPAFTGVRKYCLMCGKTETPLWRNGPDGAKSLCNACGIRFKKEEKRASLMLQGKPNSSSDAKMQSIVP